jgi:hypothetical protein
MLALCKAAHRAGLDVVIQCSNGRAPHATEGWSGYLSNSPAWITGGVLVEVEKLQTKSKVEEF